MGPRRVPDDDRLAQLAADGDERAFTRIYERHHQGLYRYCRSILHNDEDAADALQNTMVKTLRALPGESRGIALKPWLYRIAHNEAISVLRRRLHVHPIDGVAEIGSEQELDSATADRLHMLVADLAELPERQRGALVMRELSGLSYEEIGAALDSSPAAAKQSVYEARETLHRLAEGRAMECEAAHRLISAQDRRVLRGRKLRAHLRSCEGCRGFERAISTRRADLALLAPPPAAAVLKGILGGGASGGSVLGMLTGAAGNAAAGSVALKATVAAVTVAIGVGGYEVAERPVGIDIGGPPSSTSSPGAGPATGGRPRSGAEGDLAAGKLTPAVESDRGATRGPGVPGEGLGRGQPATETTRERGGTPDGLVDKGGTPPGLEGAAPPGHGGTPPGLSEAPPGHGASLPGPHSDTAPRPGEAPPGLDGAAPPGRGGTPPGLAEAAPQEEIPLPP